MMWRRDVRPSDREAVLSLVRATAFFHSEEESIAMELVDERLRLGEPSGYHFVFADGDDDLLGYTCYGPTPATKSSFDLYWIAVHPKTQGHGLGRKLMQESERLIAEMGGTHVWVETSGREQYVPTRAFYRSCGYEVAATLPDFYAPGDSKVILLRVVR
jgi:ribosomal protein S18 acetylase RimI-like enzyme